MRLDKYLSLAQVATRKKVKEYIYNGDVTVNEKMIRIPAYEVNEMCDRITYQGMRIESIQRICYMFHKPGDCVTAKSDLVHKTVFDYFEDIDPNGLFAVGRLDKETEGMLLVTNDGELNHKLMNPDSHVSKTYYFWVFGEICQDDITQIESGVDLGKGEITSPATLTITAEGSYTKLKKRMEEEGCKKVKRNLHRQAVTAGYLTISEGKKHQIKRMMRKIGCYVVYLKRTSIGSLSLDETLKPGEFRRLTEEEVKKLLFQNQWHHAYRLDR